MNEARCAVLDLVGSLVPVDETEREHRDLVLDWLRGDQPIYRTAPDVPDRHLVSYFVVLDPAYRELLLVAHRKAGRWLPTGGHLHENEHPWRTVERECAEELRLVATPIDELGRRPLFLTANRTRGARPHTDVSLWFVITAGKDSVSWFDESEFGGVRWFTPAAVRAEPIEHLDRHMHRFIDKLDRTVG
jgi:8-oxo-dGTP pyrophosphatase MutT (NUDIX family)